MTNDQCQMTKEDPRAKRRFRFGVWAFPGHLTLIIGHCASVAIFLVVFALSQASGADVSYYALIKSQQWLQTNSAGAILPATNAWAFDALVVANLTNGVTNATIQGQYPSPLETLVLQSNRLELLFEQRFDTQSAMDGLFPNGPIIGTGFTVTMFGTNDGVRTGTLSFPSGSFNQYPSSPTLANFTAAQSVDSTTDFTFLWNFSGGKTSDVVQVTVVGTAGSLLFSSPAPFSTNALTGLSNSIVIPAYTLPAGSNLQAHLSVGRPVGANTSSYPGATGIAVLGIDIQFPLVTRPDPVHPRLTVLSTKPAPPRLQFTGETNRNYHLQFTTNFVSWQDLLVTNSPTGTGTVTDTSSPIPGKRFYRIKVGP